MTKTVSQFELYLLIRTIEFCKEQTLGQPGSKGEQLVASRYFSRHSKDMLLSSHLNTVSMLPRNQLLVEVAQGWPSSKCRRQANPPHTPSRHHTGNRITFWLFPFAEKPTHPHVVRRPSASSAAQLPQHHPPPPLCRC